uniref:interleukin-17 receptor A-like isoform X1 n=2 Tax=Myxine glutinosa TaxID=7769 RepID=UPI00358E0FF7
MLRNIVRDVMRFCIISDRRLEFHTTPPRDVYITQKIMVFMLLLLLIGAGTGTAHHHVDCSSMELNCTVEERKMANCSKGGARWTPTPPLIDLVKPVLQNGTLGGPLPLLIGWKMKTDASIQFVKATEVCLQEVGADGAECVWFFYHHNFTTQTKDERGTRWKFSFSGFLVQRGVNYSVILRNLPCVNQRAIAQVAIPGYKPSTIPWTTTNRPTSFTPAPPNLWLWLCPLILITCFILIPALIFGLHYNKGAANGGRDNDTSAQTGTGPAEQEVPLKTSKPRRVLILYSLDHKLYKNTVLRLAELLQHTCGVEVTLDLWQMHKIACVGHLQWLSYQMARIDQSEGKVLLLCSRGTMEKWRAHCGMRPPIRMCEDLRSPTGDLFTPALTLLSGDFGTVSALGKYAVAYFKDVSKETDIPDVFRTLPTYHLMDHLEELFFRLQGLEQHSPGVTLHSLGISASAYSSAAFGERLHRSLVKFQVFQSTNPDWFDEECRDKGQEIESAGDPEPASVDFCLENELVYHKAEDVGPSINCFDGELSTRAVGNQLQEVKLYSNDFPTWTHTAHLDFAAGPEGLEGGNGCYFWPGKHERR